MAHRRRAQGNTDARIGGEFGGDPVGRWDSGPGGRGAPPNAVSRFYETMALSVEKNNRKRDSLITISTKRDEKFFDVK